MRQGDWIQAAVCMIAQILAGFVILFPIYLAGMIATIWVIGW